MDHMSSSEHARIGKAVTDASLYYDEIGLGYIIAISISKTSIRI